MNGKAFLKSYRCAAGALLLFAACNPIAVPKQYTPPDVPAFDAGSADDEVPGNRCPESPAYRFDNRYSPFFGGEEAVDVEVAQFSNFSCPHCADFASMTRDLWNRREDFRRRVRIYFHHYPFDYEIPWEQHRSAVAAANQGMDHFWEMHDFIYDGLDSGNQYGKKTLFDFAEQNGLDRTRFEADYESEETIAFITWDRDQCLRTGASGTPSVFVCGEPINWSLLESEVDRLLYGDSR